MRRVMVAAILAAAPAAWAQDKDVAGLIEKLKSADPDDAENARRYLLYDGESVEKFYWVDAEGRLLKVQIGDEGELILSDEADARKLDTDD
jgi:hypothetical protein